MILHCCSRFGCGIIFCTGYANYALEQIGAQDVLIRTVDGYAADLSVIRVMQEQ